MVSQGKPFLLVSVATCPSLIRLSPPSVAAHRVLSESSFRALTRPPPNPSAVPNDARTSPCLKYTTPPFQNPNQKPPRMGSTTRESENEPRLPSFVQGIHSTGLPIRRRQSPCSVLAAQMFPLLSPVMGIA